MEMRTREMGKEKFTAIVETFPQFSEERCEIPLDEGAFEGVGFFSSGSSPALKGGVEDVVGETGRVG